MLALLKLRLGNRNRPQGIHFVAIYVKGVIKTLILEKRRHK